VTSQLTRKLILTALAAILLIFAGFACGFVSCLQLKSAVPGDLREQYLLQPGDASPTARAGVLDALRVFQDGYARRDPSNLDAFMHRLFPNEGDVLILGTDSGEWIRGYPATSEFIKGDWMNWGDFKFSVDNAAIWSSGDVAWVATPGVVRFKGGDRPVRFTAILTRNESDWVFRQAQFQWDERNPVSADLLHPGTYLRLTRLALHRMAPAAF
jgi:hypothetical protein